MRSLAILSNKAARELQPNCLILEDFELYNAKFLVALLKSDESYFPENDPNYFERVLIRKKAFSLNFRDKGIIMANRPRPDTSEETFLKLEIGSEFAGEVIQIGRNVSSLKIGDRIIPNGQYPSAIPDKVLGGLPTNAASREFEVFHELELLKIPDELSNEVAASFSIGAQTSYSIIRKLDLKKDQKILITSGSSNTSLFCLSALMGIKENLTILTSQQSVKLRLMEMGVGEVILINDRMAVNDNDILTERKRSNRLFDVIIDPFADIFMPQLIDFLNINGKYVTCGFYHQSFKAKEDNFKLSQFIATMIVKNITFIGNCLGETQDLLQAIDDYKNGTLEVLIDSTFSGNDIKTFLQQSFAETGRFGKVVYCF